MKNRHLKVSIRVFLSIILFVVGGLLLVYGLTSKKYVNIKYAEDNKVNYKVYLKENNFFETNYLGENRTYIASLIDYIDIDYNYLITFDKVMSGNYSYYIKGIISANKPNGDDGYYWQKEYRLTKPKKIDIHDTNSFQIKENIKVDYDKYNNILDSFKKEYSMQTDGQLIISLVVESTTRNKLYDNDVKVNSDLKLSVPLLQQTVEASIEKDATSKSQTISFQDHTKDSLYLYCKIIGILIISLAILLFISALVYLFRKSKRNLYITKLNKILHNHDSIIANINTLPDTSELNIIEISSFEELIDVYNEVRMPINYYQNDDDFESTFIIINDGIAWVYILSKENMEDEQETKEKRKG